MNNLLVTGGAGFIGGSLVRLALGTAGWGIERLVNLDLLTYAGYRGSLAGVEADARHVFVEGDIGDCGCYARQLAERNCTRQKRARDLPDACR